jgi:hypothetical protein
MNDHDPLWVHCWLRPSLEPLSGISDRISKFLSAAQTIDPLLSNFYLAPLKEGDVWTKTVDANLMEWIDAFSNQPGPDPGIGRVYYSFAAVTHPGMKGLNPSRLTFWVHAGRDDANSAFVSTDDELEPDERLFQFGFLRELIFTLADAFDPLLVMVNPDPVGEAQYSRGRPPLKAHWIFLLCPDLADRVMPPSACISERRSDGRLLMAATTKRPDKAIASDVAAVRALHDVVAPINRWPLYHAKKYGGIR